MIEMNFKSNYIRNFREKYNLSQYELADLMNVNQSTIARWEKGEKTPSHENIAKLNKNPKRKRATTKLALTILDEKIKRG